MPRPAAPVEHLDAKAWRSLGRSLSGRLVLPHDHGYARARELYDPRFDRARPHAIAYCASPSDVQRAVDFARTHGVRPIPRSGGHSYAGYSTGRGLVIDVTPMHAASFSRPKRHEKRGTAEVGAGTRLVDLYAACARAGWLVPGGSCPTVGIAGLALGGGIGVMARKYSLTCDELKAVRIVTPDGRLLTCDHGHHADLFWASRGGGGGNFGVATSFTFVTHRIPEQLTLFTIDWPWAAAQDALSGWMRWVKDAPDEVWSNFQLLSAQRLIARASGVVLGDRKKMVPLVSGLMTASGAGPLSTFLGHDESFLHVMLVEAGCDGKTVAQCHLPSQNRAGQLSRAASAAKSAYVARPFPAGGLLAAADAVQQLRTEHPGLGGGLAFDAYGGAINRVPSDATAFVHRGALCSIQATVNWSAHPTPSGRELAAGEGWLASAAQALRPYTTGGAYQNYIDPTLADWQHAYYSANLPRLTAVKRAYDPDDTFHFPQSIPLAP